MITYRIEVNGMKMTIKAGNIPVAIKKAVQTYLDAYDATDVYIIHIRES